LRPREARWLVRSGKISSSVDIGKHVTPFDNFVAATTDLFFFFFQKPYQVKAGFDPVVVCIFMTPLFG
jgi:hypothetical protein